MELVLVVLAAALTGAFSASLPLPDLSLPAVLESSLDSALDTLGSEKVRRSVLDDVKQLLDTQISALLEDGVKRIAGKKGLLKRQLKSKRSRLPAIQDDKQLKLKPSRGVESLIKILTDGLLQDSADTVLRNSVDEVIEENEDQVESNNSKTIKDTTEDDKAEQPINKDGMDDENNVVKNKKEKRKSKKQGKDVDHIIIEHSPLNHHDGEAHEDVVDLDEILKSALKDLSDSSSHDHDLKDDDSVDENVTNEIEANQKDKETPIKRNHDKSKEHDELNIENEKHKIDEAETEQLDNVKHIQVDESYLKSVGSQSKEKDDIQVDQKIKQKHSEHENHHKKHHGKHHGHEKHTLHHKHQTKNDHHAEDKISNASTEDKIKSKDYKDQNHDKESHINTSSLKSHIKENKKQTSIEENHTSFISWQNDNSEVEENISAAEEKKQSKASHVDEHVTQKKDASGKQHKITKAAKISDKERNLTEEDKSAKDVKKVEEKDSIDKEEKHSSKEEDNITEIDKSSTDEGLNVTEEENNASTDEDEGTIEKHSTEIKDAKSEEKKGSSDHKTGIGKKHTCKVEKNYTKGKSHESLETDDLLHELIEDKDMTRTYTFSLTLTKK